METEIIIATAALIVSLLGFAWSLYERLKLEKKKLAIEMLKEWNNNTSADTEVLRSNYPGQYDKCVPLAINEVDKIIHPDKLSNHEMKKYIDIKVAIIRLLNYFEYVSAAFNRGSVDKKIIRNSFSVTMLRYYIVLRNFMIMQFLVSKRNHWRPFTKHLKSLILKREKLVCAGCTDDSCILKLDGQSSRVKLIDLLNKGNLNENDISEMKKELDSKSI